MGNSIHKEISERSTELIKFLADMRDRPVEVHCNLDRIYDQIRSMHVIASVERMLVRGKKLHESSSSNILEEHSDAV